jgi:plasmid stabilization system protein ParE
LETAYTLRITSKARLQIEQIAIYIEENGYPETAERFALKMFDFAESLAFMPDKYTICRKPAFKRWDYRCATFHANYVFIYQVAVRDVILKQVLHAKLMK